MNINLFFKCMLPVVLFFKEHFSFWNVNIFLVPSSSTTINSNQITWGRHETLVDIFWTIFWNFTDPTNNLVIQKTIDRSIIAEAWIFVTFIYPYVQRGTQEVSHRRGRWGFSLYSDVNSVHDFESISMVRTRNSHISYSQRRRERESPQTPLRNHLILWVLSQERLF